VCLFSGENQKYEPEIQGASANEQLGDYHILLMFSIYYMIFLEIDNGKD
jgi:hypothetical protein